jgi:hypothetical protein
MSNLRAFNQTVLERKRYTVSYRRWMDEDETLFDHAIVISPETSPALIAQDAFSSAADTEITFFLTGGVAGTVYEVALVATTSDGQVKQDNLQLAVF